MLCKYKTNYNDIIHMRVNGDKTENSGKGRVR